MPADRSSVSASIPAGTAALRGLAAWLVTIVALRAVVLQPERCGSPTHVDALGAATLTVGWLESNLQDDGRWLYRYDRSTDTDLGNYNLVRHTGAIEALEKAASAGIVGAAETADGGTTWALARLEPAGPGVAPTDATGIAPVGGAALLAAGLVERRERTGDDTHDEVLIGMGRFMASMVQPDGAVLGRYDTRSGAAVPESWSKFYTGEVFWALARLHQAFPSEGFDEPTLRIAGYLPDRDEREEWWPTIPDHWAAYGFATMTRWDQPPRLSEAQVGWIEEQLELQSIQIRYESQRTDGLWTHLTRGRPTLGAGLGTLGEALDQWWVVAGTDERLEPHRPVIAERGACVTGVLIERQAPDGAWYQFEITQLDDQQHTLSALLFVEELLAADQAADR